MEIAVCLTRVPDTAEADVKVDASGKDIVRDKLAFTINEADNYALEEALLAKEKHNANVTLVSVGPKEAEEVLRRFQVQEPLDFFRLRAGQHSGDQGQNRK